MQEVWMQQELLRVLPAGRAVYRQLLVQRQLQEQQAHRAHERERCGFKPSETWHAGYAARLRQRVQFQRPAAD